MADNVFQAYNTMRLDIDLDKFRAIVRYTQDRISVSATQVADFIDGGWTDDPDGHQGWIKSASATEIAGWVVAGLR